MSDISKNICYSLPRLITMATQCSFCAYFWELYTTDFGWTPAEYGKVSSIYSFTQIFSFMILGIVFKFAIEDHGGNNKLMWSKGILVTVTYFLLIILPIRWYGIKTPFVGSIFGQTSKFWYTLINGPVGISNLTSNKYLWIIFCILYFPFRVCWTLLYPFMWLFYLIIINYGKICRCLSLPLASFGAILARGRTTGRNYLTPYEVTKNAHAEKEMRIRILRHLFPDLVDQLPVITKSKSVANTIPFMSTKTFCVYFLTILNGIGVSAHEISNKAIPTYMHSEDTKIGSANIMNLNFFFVSNLFIILLFSLLKFYVRSKGAFAETFYLISILYLALCFPFLLGFILGTSGSGNSTATKFSPWQDYCKVACLTVFHSTVVFLIFSGGPLTFYLATFILGGHKVLMSFGVLILNVGLTGASWLFMILGENPFNSTAQQIVMPLCIVGQLFTFMVLYAHDWWWNKYNWVNYVLLIVTGVVNTKFVGYTNIMLDSVIKGKNEKWIFSGAFYSGTNAVVSRAMLIMFNSFGKDKTINYSLKCIRFNYHYCFPTVYKAMIGVFIVANAIAAVIYFLIPNPPNSEVQS